MKTGLVVWYNTQQCSFQEWSSRYTQWLIHGFHLLFFLQQTSLPQKKKTFPLHCSFFPEKITSGWTWWLVRLCLAGGGYGRRLRKSNEKHKCSNCGSRSQIFGRREAGTTKKKLWKNHACFWGHAPVKKKGGESIFEGIFRFWEKNVFSKKKILGGERRERRKEGTTERGNNWNDTTSALFKNLVIK